MEDTYTNIILYYPIYPEQDSERRGYELQPPKLPAMAQDHMRVSYQSKVSPQSQHYMKEGAEGVSIFYDNPLLNHSPYSSHCPPICSSSY